MATVRPRRELAGDEYQITRADGVTVMPARRRNADGRARVVCRFKHCGLGSGFVCQPNDWLERANRRAAASAELAGVFECRAPWPPRAQRRAGRIRLAIPKGRFLLSLRSGRTGHDDSTASAAMRAIASNAPRELLAITGPTTMPWRPGDRRFLRRSRPRDSSRSASPLLGKVSPMLTTVPPPAADDRNAAGSGGAPACPHPMASRGSAQMAYF